MNQVSNPQDNDLPYVFISHKHADRKIADKVSSFLTRHSGARVKVHQSSSTWADAPKVGRNLNKQLKEFLWHTSVVILIYTDPEHDWSYCMWECGVALQPQTPDTKIILFQCAGRSPTLFAEQVNVDVRSEADIQRFTNEFLTAEDFFPGVGHRMTKFQPNGQEVIRAATEFHRELKEVLPREEAFQDWPAYPFLQLELDLDHCDQIKKLPDLERRTEIVHNESRISGADKYCEILFGMLTLELDLSFKRLTDSWKAKCPSSSPTWVEAVVKQVAAGVVGDFPPRIWKKMDGVNTPQCYSPVLTRVRKLPVRQCMQFDIYFFFEESVIGVSGSPLGNTA